MCEELYARCIIRPLPLRGAQVGREDYDPSLVAAGGTGMGVQTGLGGAAGSGRWRHSDATPHS